ncbi:hypothetical protein AB9P05_22500 [Roseivirga sp. BDSF3-8]|uniref:hypothetical protein n=1 Tax=Roseivirga sp. BDSF3-8 TaxID=3241598 RepID=UPI003531CBA1
MTGLKKLLLASIAAVAVMTGCTRDDEEQILREADDISGEQAEMIIEMEKAQSLFFDATEQASYASGSEETSEPKCYEVVYNESKGDMKFVVGFGEGCKDQFGVTRSGKITQNNRTTDKGVEMSYKLENYAVDGYTLSGTVSVNSLKRDDKGMLTYTYKLEDAKVGTPQGKSYLVSRTLQFRQADNPGSINYYVTGGGSVINAAGVEYTSEIVKPALYKGGCFSEGNFYPLSGVAQVDFEDGKFFTVDFGSGSCDKAAKILAGEKELALALK